MRISNDNSGDDEQFRLNTNESAKSPLNSSLELNLNSNNPLYFDGALNVGELLRLLSNKVNIIHGKGLSTNDFTNAYKTELDNLVTTVTNIVADAIESGTINQEIIQLIQQSLDNYVLKTTTINNHALTQNIVLTPSDLGLIFGNITENGSDVLNITGGHNAVLGPGVAIDVKQVSNTQDGYLSATQFVQLSNPDTYRELFTAVDGQTIITLQHTPKLNTERVVINGLEAYPGALNDYTLTNNVITFTYNLIAGEKIKVTYN